MRATESAKNLAAISYEKQSFILLFAFTDKRPVFFQLLWPRRFQAAVVPSEFYRRHVASRCKALADDRRHRISLLVSYATGLQCPVFREFRSSMATIQLHPGG